MERFDSKAPIEKEDEPVSEDLFHAYKQANPELSDPQIIQEIEADRKIYADLVQEYPTPESMVDDYVNGRIQRGLVDMRFSEVADREKVYGAETIEEKYALNLELSESGETFPFPGVTADAIAKAEAEEAEAPGYRTPIAELQNKFSEQGMKVVVGRFPGNVYVLPADSDDLYSEGLLPRFLDVNAVGDERLKQLILKDQA